MNETNRATMTILRFSDSGFIPTTPDYIESDNLESGVFAFFKERANELLLNHYHPNVRYRLKCYEAEIDCDCVVYNVDELFEQGCESTAEAEFKINADEIFIPNESIGQIKNIKEINNIFSP